MATGIEGQREDYRNPAPLTPGQAGRVTQAVATWFRVLRAEDEKRPEGSGRCFPPTDADVTHSALLQRLLSGKPPLPKAPPKRFSYPCYELGEGKPVKIHELWEGDLGGRRCVVIDQCQDWEWVEVGHVDEDRKLRHVPTGDIYRFAGPSTIQRESEGEPPPR
jgi:hypothetical protein